MEKLVLVAIVNREKDLKIALNRHWYRIPVKYAPKKEANFLSLYQTSVFNDNGKSINLYAPIKEYSLTYRRNLLPEEKDHPRVGELYQKLTLGPIRQTPRRIKNKTGLRVNFGFTTLKKLLQAKDLCELFGIAPLEQITYRELQKNKIKAIRQYCIMKNGRCRYRLDFAIFCKKGKIDIECDNEKLHYQPRRKTKDRKRNNWLKRHGWKILRLPGKNIITNPQKCIRKIKHLIHLLGGRP
jgi:very-short-patch-repair endonuclease